MPVGPYTTVRRPIGYVTATGRTFFTFQKRDFTFFWNGVPKIVKSRWPSLVRSSPSRWVHILRSVITVIHFSYLFVSLVYLRTYRHLSHTVLSWIVSCGCEYYVRISEQRCLMALTFGNCVLKNGVIEWTLKLCVRFLRFFQNTKTWLFTFLELLHTFSRTLVVVL